MVAKFTPLTEVNLTKSDRLEEALKKPIRAKGKFVQVDDNPHNIPENLEAPGGFTRIMPGERLQPGVDRYWTAEENEMARNPISVHTPEDCLTARVYPSGFYCRPIEQQPLSSIELTIEDRRAIEKAEYVSRTQPPAVVRIQNQGYIDPADDL